MSSSFVSQRNGERTAPGNRILGPVLFVNCCLMDWNRRAERLDILDDMIRADERATSLEI